MNCEKCLSATCTNDLCGLVRVTIQTVDLDVKLSIGETGPIRTEKRKPMRERRVAGNQPRNKVKYVFKRSS
jgi:hypothetical protein